MDHFIVYIIFSERLNRFYIGTTDDFSKRLEEHNFGHFKDSFSKKGIPWTRFLLIENLESTQAYQIEMHIKSMKSAVYIRNLKSYPEMVTALTTKFL